MNPCLPLHRHFRASRLNWLRTVAILAVFPFLLVFHGNAAVDVASVEAALARMSTQRLDHWRFSAIERTNSEVRRMRYHPVREGIGRVELVQVNGEEPTPKQLEQFAKHHPPRSAEAPSHHGYALHELITPGSLRWQSTEQGIASFAFTPRFAFAGAPRSDYPMVGTLSYDPQRELITSFDIRTLESFRPKRGARVDHFFLTIDFEAHASGAVLTQRIRTRFEGKALWLLTIFQDIEIFYFDYLPVSMPADPERASTSEPAN